MRPTALLSACFLALLLASPSFAAKKSKKAQPQTPPAVKVEEPPPPPEPEPAPEAAPAEPVAEVKPEKQTGLPGAPGAAAVFVVPRSKKDTERAQKLEPELMSQLRAKGMPIVDLTAAFPPGPPRSLSKGEQLFTEAKTAYDNLELEGAKKLFGEAIAFHLAHAYETNPQNIAPIYLYLGSTSLLLSDAEGAKEAFRGAAMIKLDFSPDTELFASEVVDGYGAAWEWVAQQKPGKLEIQSEPPGAEVLIAGKSVGTTPVTVERPFSKVRIELKRAGYEPTAVFAEVKSEATTPVTVPLHALPGLVATREMADGLATEANFQRKEVTDEGRAVGERLGARYLVLAAIHDDEDQVQAWDLQAGTRLEGLSISEDGVPEVARKIDAWTRGEYSEEKNDLFSKLPDVMKRPWFWAAVGGVAAASAGAVWAVSSSGSPRAPFVVTGIP